jgi:ABC-type glutathione transport system ATPase component
MSTADPLLVAEGLQRSYRQRTGVGSRPGGIEAVDGVSLQLDRAESLGIVGGSGSGKSTLARLLLALERPDKGVVRFRGNPISTLPESRIRPLRRDFQAVFQDPSASLDPCLRVGTIVAEPLVAHSIGSGSERRQRIAELLAQVGLSPQAAGKRAREFSGGERQRIAIARALATGPRLLILDEPTSSLDVSVQAQIIDLMTALRRRHELALVWISHDLAVVRDVCDKVAVMFDGKFVEEGPTAQVLENPRHSYTRALLDAAPPCKAPFKR